MKIFTNLLTHPNAQREVRIMGSPAIDGTAALHNFTVQHENRFQMVPLDLCPQATILLYRDELREVVIELRPVRPLRRATDAINWLQRPEEK